MRIGFVGLGRMGLHMVQRILKKHQVVAWNRSPEPRRKARRMGAITVKNVEELPAKLKNPRIIWLMVPAGKVVDVMINKLTPHLDKGDILVDGGNTNYKDTLRRAKKLSKKGILYADCGTSGGLGGAKEGYSLMVGSDKKTFKKIRPILHALANNPPHGYARVGSVGMGNYVKTVHNGIEYAICQAIGEGFEILTKAPEKLCFSRIAHVWNHGGVIRSWLMELAEQAFKKDDRLSKIKGVIGGGSTGSWAVQEAKRVKVKVPLIEKALQIRKATRKKEGSFAAKVVAELRNGFGGHSVKKK